MADALRPHTRAYHSIWIDGDQLDLDDPANKDFVDPLYGKTYLPRKFKVAFAIPPVNDIDVFTNCLGFIAIVDNDQLVGYNLAVGGGMGRSHGNEQTYPRLADVIGFLPPDKLVDVAKAVLTIHRDFGDRTDRKHARLKYVVEERGVDWTRAELEKRAGFKLAPAKPFKFTTTATSTAGTRQRTDSWFLALVCRNRPGQGRRRLAAEDRPARRSAEKFPTLEFHLTPNQNIILANVVEADKAGINALLAAHGVQDGKPGQHPARRLDGLPGAAHLRPGAGRVGAHAARPD